MNCDFLTSQEWERYRNVIPAARTCYWLRTGNNGRVRYVDQVEHLIRQGCSPKQELGYRPVLRGNNISEGNKPGSRMQLQGMSFMVLDNNLLLKEEVVNPEEFPNEPKYRPFGRTSKWDESNAKQFCDRFRKRILEIRFTTPEEMLQYLYSGKELYFPETEIYVFSYSENSSIAYYSIDHEEAIQLQQDAEERCEYWSAFLGPGGWIIDPSGEESGEQEYEPIDFCRECLETSSVCICTDDAINYLKGGR